MTVDQPGRDQPSPGAVELPLRHRRHRADQFVREVSAQGGPDLRHLAHRRQAVEAGQQRFLQVVGIAKGIIGAAAV
jgi:hypothetical protein